MMLPAVTSHHLARKQLERPTIKQLVTTAKRWPQMKLLATKIMSSLWRIFLITQRSHKFFRNTDIKGIFLHQL